MHFFQDINFTIVLQVAKLVEELEQRLVRFNLVKPAKQPSFKADCRDPIEQLILKVSICCKVYILVLTVLFLFPLRVGFFWYDYHKYMKIQIDYFSLSNISYTWIRWWSVVLSTQTMLWRRNLMSWKLWKLCQTMTLWGLLWYVCPAFLIRKKLFVLT